MFKISYKLIFIFLFFLLIYPFSTSAWTWQNIFSSSDPKIELVPSNDLSQQEKIDIEKKYNSWNEALSGKDLSLIKSDERNFRLSEVEVNYMLSYHVNSCKDPYFSTAKIDFKKNFIRLEGHLLKPLNGSFTLDFIVYDKDNNLVLEVLKTKYRNITVPNFLIKRVIDKSFSSLTQTMDTYTSLEDHVDNVLSFYIDEDKISLHIK